MNTTKKEEERMGVVTAFTWAEHCHQWVGVVVGMWKEHRPAGMSISRSSTVYGYWYLWMRVLFHDFHS